MPHLFARGGRDRVLISLAVNGPLHVRAIGRAIAMDSHKAWNAVERLIESGLVVKRERAGGRKYVYLNRRLPIYRTLMSLLLALNRRWPVSRTDRAVARWHMPFDCDMSESRLDQIFHSPLRSRILLFIAAVGITDMQTIYNLLGLNIVSVMYAVNFWEKEGVVRSRWSGRHRFVELDPDFVVATELAALLRVTVASSEEYRSLREVARERLRPIIRKTKRLESKKRRP